MLGGRWNDASGLCFLSGLEGGISICVVLVVGREDVHLRGISPFK